LSGYDLAPWKPVTGRNLFIRESGAVAAQFHDPVAIEPYSSSLVGARRGLVLGKKSGLASIKIKSEELGLAVPEELHAGLLEQVKDRAIRLGGLVSNEQFREMVDRAVSPPRGQTSGPIQ
ncbi:MAG TPA: 2-isopropylmalate synthase, partial [Acidimicrobiia bacterium]